MKKSLVWRFSLIGVVMLAWTVSLFPIKDRDFMTTFQRLAEPKLEDYRQTVATGAERMADLKAQLDGLAEAAPEQAALELEYATAETSVRTAKHRLESFDRLLAESEALLADPATEIRSPYRAVKTAAEAKGNRPPLTLSNYIVVPTVAQPSNSLVLSRVRSVARGKLHLGLDLQGGTEFVIGFPTDDLPDRRRPVDIRDQITEILRNRVDSLGVVEPEIKPIGDASISLRMPSVTEDDKADIRGIIKQTARLEFHLVHPKNDQLRKEYERDPGSFELDPDYELKIMRTEKPDGSVETEELFITRRFSRVRGKHVTTAYASFNEFGSYYVSLGFNSKGAAEFAALTKEHVKKRLAIVLDGRIYSAPTITEAISGGQAQISGSFGPEEARRLASVIDSGNLPVSINIDSEFGTDPTLGKDSIKSGTMAAVLGLILVLLFMIVYYRVAGVIAVIALAGNMLLVFGTLALSGATITLPGIAGIVLTIGMAVDANVLIFERIREEIANGKSLSNAIKSGYKRAFVTILDANLTTLITAVILWMLGTGAIRGFAVTLSIGIVASMFTALFMTRAIFDLLVDRGWIKGLSMASIIKKPSFDFLRARHVAIGISAALVLLTLVTILVRGSNALSIDFAGGTAVTFLVEGEKPSVGVARQAVKDLGHSSARVGYKYAAQSDVRLLEVVLAKRSTNEADLDLDALEKGLNEKLAPAVLKRGQTNSVGSLIGERFRWKALWAAVWATLAIIVYISFRFEFAYGVASVVALIHDVVIAGGIYLLCGRQLSLPVVAALLTIMGYSLNDTIVVFDRIREDLGLLHSKSYREIINLSINQTLSRTLLTSLTTLLVVVVLFLFGGGAINDFALVMMVGVVVGTYSSIFVASTMIAAWHKPTRQERG